MLTNKIFAGLTMLVTPWLSVLLLLRLNIQTDAWWVKLTCIPLAHQTGEAIAFISLIFMGYAGPLADWLGPKKHKQSQDTEPPE